MTKQEILDKLQKDNPGSIPTFKAMDEWAQYISQAFDSWKWDNRWHSFENGYWYQTLEHPSAMPEKTYNKHHRKTPQELYNQFIEQQNKTIMKLKHGDKVKATVGYATYECHIEERFTDKSPSKARSLYVCFDSEIRQPIPLSDYKRLYGTLQLIENEQQNKEQ